MIRYETIVSLTKPDDTPLTPHEIAAIIDSLRPHLVEAEHRGLTVTRVDFLSSLRPEGT